MTSLCARSRGEPSSAHCEQRVSDGSPLARANPCAPAPECGDAGDKGSRYAKARNKAGKTMQPKSKRQPAFVLCAPTRSAASRAGMAGWAGEGGGLILPALAKSALVLLSPPCHPVTARCAACGYAGRNAGCLLLLGCIVFPACLPACSFFRVTPHSGAGAHGIARARGEPSDNLCSQCAEDGSPLERAQSEVTPFLQKSRTCSK